MAPALPTWLESLTCCAGRGDGLVKPMAWPSEGAARGGKAAADAPGDRGQVSKPLVAVADPAMEETVRLAQQLLPGGEMSAWQRGWCTAANVGRYLRGRGGNPSAAAIILAQALAWREEYRDVLSGAREPRWQTDLRVLARGGDGVPIIYGCFRFNVPATSSNLRDIVEQMAAVMEAASKEATRHGATAADNILDCHGYRMADNLNPAPMLALMRMANQPFRDCLRTAIVIDAPRSFYMLWRAAAPFLSEKTKSKVKFVTREEAVRLLVATSGPTAAAAVDRVMALNRTPEGCRGSHFPSEVPDREDWLATRALRRAGTRRLTRALSGAQDGCHRTWLSSRLWCCRRRRPLPPSEQVGAHAGADAQLKSRQSAWGFGSLLQRRMAPLLV